MAVIHFADVSQETDIKTMCKKIFSMQNVKIAILTLIWLLTTIIFIIKPEETLKFIHLDVPPKVDKIFSLNQNLEHPRLDVYLVGAFSTVPSNSTKSLKLYTAIKTETKMKRISEIFSFGLVDEKNFETSDTEEVSAVLMLSKLQPNDESEFFIILNTNCDVTFTLSMAYKSKPFSVTVGIIVGAIILIGLYILIVFEIVDRTFAAIIAANLSIAALAIFNQRPTIEKIISWIDIDTLMLLFGMMILVSITSETGIFDYMAVLVYKKTKGKLWSLICSLSIITMISSMLIDSVSTILLMTPMVIRICEVSNLKPVPILIINIIAVNIASAASPIGNPPNIMMINNSYIAGTNLTFFGFLSHMLPGVILIIIQTFIQLRYFTFRNVVEFQNEDRLNISNLKHEIDVYEKDCRTISHISKFDDMHRSAIRSKINLLKESLQREMERQSEDDEADFETMYAIKDKRLLIQCSIAFSVVILLLVLHSAPHFKNISMGWAALLGVVLLLIISNNNYFKECLLLVEWSSLLFFAALFVLMESLTEIGLITFIGNQLSEVIKLASIEYRMFVAITLLLWVSVIISAFLDNIPLVSMMIKVVVALSSSLNINIQPLVWALACACGIGGNGTLIASSANLVCVGVAEQHGYKFSFSEFFKIGFPLMLVNTVFINLYLVICHVAFNWQ